MDLVTKFEEFTYTRPEFEEIEQQFGQALAQFTSANSVKEQSEAMKSINDIRNNVGTMMNIVYILLIIWRSSRRHCNKEKR